MHWGDIADDGCVGPGSRKWSAILWDIPWGKSWEEACAETAAPNGSPPGGRTPDNCVTGINEWGEWYVADDSCRAHWGAITDSGCSDIDKRKYSAVIWNVPPGQTWEDACATTPAPGGTPVAGRVPDRCRSTGFNMWGEWDVTDQACRPHWGSLVGGCVANGVERYSAVLWDIPAGVSWERVCASTPAPEGSVVAGRIPTRCVAGANIWGEWDVANGQCVCEDRQVVECYTVDDPGECRPPAQYSGGTCCEQYMEHVCYYRPLAPSDRSGLLEALRAGHAVFSPTHLKTR
jgi:hypothetical protein